MLFKTSLNVPVFQAYSWGAIRNDVSDALDSIAESEAVFTSRAKVDEAFEELLAELQTARTAHPGLENRFAFMEQTPEQINERLSLRLRRMKRARAVALLPRLLNGDADFASETLGPLSSPLWIVRRRTILQGAQLFRILQPRSLFDEEEEDDLFDDYRAWRAMYLGQPGMGGGSCR